MPDLTIVGLRQTAILWSRYGTTAKGEPTLCPAVEIPVRWTNRSTRSQAPRDGVVAYDARVAVGQVVPIGSIMWEGAISDAPDGDDILSAATSTTSTPFGSGTKTFTTQSGLGYAAGDRLRIGETNLLTHYMTCKVVSYSGTTLVVTVTSFVPPGSGPTANWTIWKIQPLPTTNLMEVVSSNVARDVKGRSDRVRRELGLMRWNATLPTVVDV